MNAIDLLKEDHDIVDALFKEVEATTPSRYPPLFKRIKGELDTHAHVEETIFYPMLLKKGDAELADIVQEGIEEHKQIKMFLAELERSTPKNEQFEAKIKVLIEDTRHHVKEEENEMFPLVEDQFTETELEKLGAELEKEKKKFQSANKIKPEEREKALGPVGRLVRILTGPSDGRDKETQRSREQTSKGVKRPSGNGGKSNNGKATGKPTKAAASSGSTVKRKTDTKSKAASKPAKRSTNSSKKKTATKSKSTTKAASARKSPSRGSKTSAARASR
jgi:iron-sulfur cluster repair protein YtfE (RIC family)